uniref:Peroxidase n=1 Tax=Kalanchoe fedtschenkoi TaxID=63787 RepID=A0A7N0TA25_KALFE
MGSHSCCILILLLSVSSYLSKSESKLTENYYQESCPRFQEIVKNVITEKQLTAPTTAAATIRLFFHDCVVEGCDASLLIASNAFNKAERDAEDNLSLPGDGFDVVIRAKTALELECPNIVSCSDILSAVARDLVTMVGGPYYPVRLGRKDGLVSDASRVPGNLARPNMTMDQIIAYFGSKGFTVQEMVALLGAHTIGFSHCGQFSDRIFNYSKKSDSDPACYPKYAEALRKLCANYKKDETLSAFNDVMTPGKFDNMYYMNLQRGLGLLASDQAMAVDSRTKPFVELYASNQAAFFKDFAKAMEKVSVYKIKTGKKGEVRRRCDAFNTLKT